MGNGRLATSSWSADDKQRDCIFLSSSIFSFCHFAVYDDGGLWGNHGREGFPLFGDMCAYVTPQLNFFSLLRLLFNLLAVSHPSHFKKVTYKNFYAFPHQLSGHTKTQPCQASTKK